MELDDHVVDREIGSVTDDGTRNGDGALVGADLSLGASVPTADAARLRWSVLIEEGAPIRLRLTVTFRVAEVERHRHRGRGAGEKDPEPRGHVAPVKSY
jgi:hypothetical protein